MSTALAAALRAERDLVTAQERFDGDVEIFGADSLMVAYRANQLSRAEFDRSAARQTVLDLAKQTEVPEGRLFTIAELIRTYADIHDSHPGE